MTAVTVPLPIVILSFFWACGISAGLAYTVVFIIKQRKIRPSKTALVKDMSLDDIAKELTIVEKRLSESVQHVGIVRFNPFNDVGGDQSYAIALLNGKGNGVVISNIHSRTISRTYAKRVTAGKSLNHELSSEEERAIAQALAATKAE